MGMVQVPEIMDGFDWPALEDDFRTFLLIGLPEIADRAIW
jgi:hypothetical protein